MKKQLLVLSLLAFILIIPTVQARSLIVAESVNITGNFTNEGTTDIIITGTSNNQINASVDNVLISSTGTSTLIQAVTNRILNFFTGAGTWDSNDLNMDVSNLSVADGGTWDAGSSTLDVDNSWTSSGGLLGPSALSLNTQHVNVSEDASLKSASTVTVEAWIKETTRSNFDVVATQGTWSDAYTLWFNSVDTPSFRIDGDTEDSADGTTDVIDGKWHHLAGIYDGSTISIYVDGELEDTTAVAGGIDYLADKFYIGMSGDSAHYFDGRIDEVRIFNDTRTEAEIRSDMFARCGTLSDANEVSCWSMDEGTGTTVADSVGSNTGTASDSGVWAAGGTFTEGTSTVNMTGDGEIVIPNSFDFYNLEVAQSGKTTTVTVPSSNKDIEIFGTLTLAGGTFTDGATAADVLIGGGTPSIDSGSDFTNIDTVIYDRESATTWASTTYTNVRGAGTPHTLGGNILVNTNTRVDSGKLLISDGYNITTETATVTGTLNITQGSALIFEDTSGAGFGTSAGTLNVDGRGKYGTGMMFDGNDQINVTHDDSLNVTTAITLATWVNIPDLTGNNVILNKGDWGSNIHWILNVNEKQRFWFGGADVSSNEAISKNTWKHIAVTYDSSLASENLKFFIDGKLGTVANSTNNESTSLNSLVLGDGSSGGFNGQMDEFYIYNRALTSQEINDTMNNYGAPSDYVGYWSFNEQNGTEAIDSSSNKNNGTLEGARYTTVRIHSASELSATNNWTINATTFSSIPPWYNTWVADGNSIGPSYVVVGQGHDRNSNVGGFWDFDSPTITPVYPVLANTTVISQRANTTVNISWTADDNNLYLMYVNISFRDNVQKHSNETSSLIGNTSWTMTNTLNISGWVNGTYTLELSASDSHNKPNKKTKSRMDKSQVRIPQTLFDKKVSKSNKKETDINSKDLYIEPDNGNSLYLEFFRDKPEVRHNVSYKGYQYTFKWAVKTDSNAKVKLNLTAKDLIYLKKSTWVGHFLFNNGQSFFDFQDFIEDAGIVKVEQTSNTTYTVTMSKKSWKANSWVLIDPTSGGANIATNYITFMLSEANPNQTFIEPSYTVLARDANLIIDTGDNAQCRLSTTNSTASFDQMTTEFQTTNATRHDYLLTDLSQGIQTTYVTCKDDYGNNDTTPINWNFTVAKVGAPTEQPSGGGTTIITANDSQPDSVIQQIPQELGKQLMNIINISIGDKEEKEFKKITLWYTNLDNLPQKYAEKISNFNYLTCTTNNQIQCVVQDSKPYLVFEHQPPNTVFDELETVITYEDSAGKVLKQNIKITIINPTWYIPLNLPITSTSQASPLRILLNINPDGNATGLRVIPTFILVGLLIFAIRKFKR